MRGHQHIIAMRHRGGRPLSVTVNTDPDQLRMWRVWPETNPAHACIQIDAEDSPGALDLRCLAGIAVVSVTGTDAQRVAAVAQACVEHNAGRVIAVCTTPWPHCEVASITDTHGALTWPN